MRPSVFARCRNEQTEKAVQTETSQYLTTAEVARLLGVTETTVKRWADARRIPYVRTPGGHRRFRRQDVLAFIQAIGYSAQEQLLRESSGSVRVSSSVVGRLQEELYRRLLAGDTSAVWRQLYSCYLAGMELAALYDEVVAPTLQRVGEQWSCGQLSVAHEHLASNTLLEALQAFRHLTRSEGLYHRRAVCAAVEPEEHVFGLLMAAHVLEGSGYRVDFLGARTPVADLAEWISMYRPHVLCLGFVMPLPEEHARELLRVLRQEAVQSGTRVFAGGRAADPAWAAEGLVDGVYSTFRGLKAAVAAV